MKFISTRNNNIQVTACQAIVNGISDDGGLYVPSSFPKVSLKEIKGLIDKSYPERASYIMSKYLDEFSYEELLGYCEKAYNKFEDQDACPLLQMDKGLYILELWHGPTHAFKDMALQIMPYLLTAAREKLKVKNRTLILVATSGDTGKAALEGFKNIDNTSIMVFYPDNGVSLMQKLQMVTQDGDNVFVGAINGNFDDAQNTVKAIFADKKMQEELDKRGYSLSSANSINWGRLVPQIAYYFSSYCDIVDSEEIALGDEINFTVPSGNFGNILAGYYAKQMGLPIKKLICASNKNNILTDFFASGRYDINRDFYKTMSPSMDILISSNLERLLFEIGGRKSDFVNDLMKSLKDKGFYEIDKKMLNTKAGCFSYGFSSEEETLRSIDNFFDIYTYMLDPHTAVAMNVYNNYVAKTQDETATVIVSTASPYKFPTDVYKAITGTELDDPFKVSKKLQLLSAQDIPKDFKGLDKMPIRFEGVYEIEKIKDLILEKIDE